MCVGRGRCGTENNGHCRLSISARCFRWARLLRLSLLRAARPMNFSRATHSRRARQCPKSSFLSNDSCFELLFCCCSILFFFQSFQVEIDFYKVQFSLYNYTRRVRPTRTKETPYRRATTSTKRSTIKLMEKWFGAMESRRYLFWRSNEYKLAYETIIYYD